MESRELVDSASESRHNSVELENEVEQSKGTFLSRLTYAKFLTVVGLAFGNFSIGACVSLQAPFFPAEAERKGATASQYGFVFGVYQVAIFCFAPIFGKTVNIIPPYITSTTGIVIVGVSSILFGILDRASNEAFIPLAIIIRMVEGIGSVSVKTSSYALIGMEFKENITFMFALLETSLGIGLIVGPTLGGLMYQVGGYTAPFAVVGVLLLVDASIMLAVLTRSGGEYQKAGELFKFCQNIPLLFNGLTVMSVFLYVGIFQTSLEPHLRKFSLSPFAVGCIFIITGTIYALTAPIVGRLCDKGVNPRIFVLIGCIMALCSQTIVGPVGFIPVETEIWMVILGLVFMGLGFSLKLVPSFVISLRDTIARGFPNDITTYGLVSTLFATSQSIGAFLGPIAGGYLLDICGFRWALLAIMSLETLLLLTLLIQFIYRYFKRTDEEMDPLLRERNSARRKSIFEQSYTKTVY